MEKEPGNVTAERMMVGRDLLGEPIWLETRMADDGRWVRQLQAGPTRGPESIEYVDPRGLQILPFRPPDWWLESKPQRRYDAGELCQVLHYPASRRVPALVVRPCFTKADHYQVRQWQTDRHRWGPCHGVQVDNMKRAEG